MVVASHAPAFLALPTEAAEYLRLVRGSDEGVTRALLITDDVLGSLRDYAREMGVSSAQYIHLVRAFLIVEGKHDESVVRHFFRRALTHDRIEVLPLAGVDNAQALGEIDLLRRLRVPLVVMFDNVSQAVIDAVLERRQPAPEHSPKEAHRLYELLRDWRPQRTRPRAVALDLPDILCAIPDEWASEALRVLYGVSDFPGWTALEREFRGPRTPRQNFKDFLAARLRVDLQPGKLLERVFELCPGDAEPDPRLRRAIESARAAVASQPSRGG